jgi:hypothetical protein
MNIILSVSDSNKCKYHDVCPFHYDCFTCNHQDEASQYCGKYREIENKKYSQIEHNLLENRSLIRRFLAI